jgi:hypothetical protein
VTDVINVKNKQLIVILTVVIAFIIIISLFILTRPGPRSLGGCELPWFYLEINVDDTNVTDNLTVEWEFLNAYSNNVSISPPKLHMNPRFYIRAENGTEYQYVGPITYEVLPNVNMSLGEMWEWNYTIEFRNFSYHSGIQYTHWQNISTGQSWFFEPGEYRIFASYYTYFYTPDDPNPIEETWWSNTEWFMIP